MIRVLVIAWVVVGLCASAPAQLNLGSDGSDGPFVFVPDAGNPNQMTIDLSLAPNAPYTTPSPMPGRGVYDQQVWAVVFKYSSISLTAGRTVRFTNHYAHPPVVWLSQTSVDLAGTVNLDGQLGSNWNQTTGNAEGGPGGFRGGRSGGTINVGYAAGMGPGGGPLASISDNNGFYWGIGGSYGTVGSSVVNGNPLGPTYGLVTLVPLMGGSGGSAARVIHTSNHLGGAGGGGGGAILIGANDMLRLRTNSRISANGGTGGQGTLCFAPCHPTGGGGSGGAIRLIGNTVQIDAGAIVVAQGGNGVSPSLGSGGLGRTRVEGNTISIVGDAHPPFSSAAPQPVFVTAATPILRVTAVNSQTPNLPPYPAGGFYYPYIDGSLALAAPVNVMIEASNVPVTPTPAVVSLQVTLRNGASMSVMANLVSGNNAASSWSATIQFPVGLSSVFAVAALP